MKNSILKGSITSIPSISTTGVAYDKPIRKVRTSKEIEEFKRELEIDEHLIGLQQLIFRYQTNLTEGLTQTRADELLKELGPNCLVAPETKPGWLVYLEFIFGGFNVLLWICAILCFVGYGISSEKPDLMMLGLMLVTVIFFTGTFGFYHQYNNNKIMDGFRKMIPTYARVTRDGHEVIIPSEEVVVGDIINIKMGDLVPADIRLTSVNNLKVNNSTITGENLPDFRTTYNTNENPLESKNLAWNGTFVVEGSGSGVVINCGDDTLIGRIAGLTSCIEKDKTHIQKEILSFVKILTIIAFTIATFFFIISMWILKNDFFVSLTFFIAMLVANVPEGLPVTLTACMTLTAKKMAKKNCLVKQLNGMEALGSCNVICSDKTGTITMNLMTVSHLYYDNKIFATLNTFELDQESKAFEALCLIGILNNSAKFLKDKTCQGDASEIAILQLMDQLIEDKRLTYKKIYEIPFNSTNKFQLSVHINPSGGNLLVMKGAPERILERCSSIFLNNATLPLTEPHKNEILKAILTLSRKGERILGFCDLNFQDDFNPEDFPKENLRFVGLMSMIDPPRNNVPEALKKCKRAGIQVIMVTGDHPVTAAAIAREVGIISQDSLISGTQNLQDYKAAIITGQDLRVMSEEELKNLLETFQELVFARTSPQQKLKIVEALQKIGKIVAVTGDGVNDSPSLKKADIGIAMMTGSDVSKEAADMILLDNDFSSIVLGIEQGRLIFDNLKKSISYVLTSNVPEILPFICFVLLGIPEALSVICILIINVGTDLWPAISLAYEDSEADIMSRQPRNPKEDNLLNYRMFYMAYGQIGLIQALASFSCYFFIMGRHGFFYSRLLGIREEWESNCTIIDSYGKPWTLPAREILSKKCYSSFLLSMVITQSVHLIVCKTRRLSILTQGFNNSVLNAGLMFSLILASFVIYTPKINEFLLFEPIYLVCILPALPYALLILLHEELRKFLIRKYPGGFMERETFF